jgi:hypothetical protein
MMTSSLALSQAFVREAVRLLGLERLDVAENPRASNVRAVRRARRIDWNPEFLAERSAFEIQVITGHEVGHHYLWERDGDIEIDPDDVEMFADVVAGWLCGRLDILPTVPDLVSLQEVLGVIPCAPYEPGANRVRAFMQGWEEREQDAPSLSGAGEDDA